MSRVAIVYFSWSWGNTESVALRIQKRTDADLYPISPVEPYPRIENEVVARARKEVLGKLTPPVSHAPIDFDAYDTVIIGSPVWWLSMAPSVRTFIEENITTLRKARIGLFATRAKWPGTALADMRALLQGCEVSGELDCEFGTDPAYERITPAGFIDAWIEDIFPS